MNIVRYNLIVKFPLQQMLMTKQIEEHYFNYIPTHLLLKRI